MFFFYLDMFVHHVAFSLAVISVMTFFGVCLLIASFLWVLIFGGLPLRLLRIPLK